MLCGIQQDHHSSCAISTEQGRGDLCVSHPCHPPLLSHPRLHLSKIHTGIFSTLPSLSQALPLWFFISAPPPPVTICAAFGLTLKLV